MSGRWFHRNIDGLEAERLLREFGQDGSFLIRPSHSDANSYTLSVRCNNMFKHIKIQNNGDNGYEIGEGGDKFATIAELVEHFIMKETLRDKLDGTILVLKYPLSSKEPTNERYFHGSISGSEAANLLLAKGKPGSYLVRESRTEPQNYVLSVRCDNQKVVHLIINYTHNGYTMQNFNKYFTTLDEFINECIKICPIVDVKDNVVNLKQPLNCSRINAMNFHARVAELEKESKFKEKNGFSEEFETLQTADGKFLYERKDGCKPENRAKNRFKTILPFDHNRIKILNHDPNDSDYINANRIQAEDSFGKTYLATQGPLPNTIEDFWAMIWQEECQIILMITHEEEKGRIKCARYWPDPLTPISPNSNQILKLDENDSIKCKDINVKFVKSTQFEDYILREFVVRKELSSSNKKNTSNDLKHHSRTVYQFQYLTWSDHGVPENIQNTLNFIEHFNQIYKEFGNRKPITVHCSAGIGRTGAVIVIDMIIDRIKTYGLQSDIDIYKTVCYLRSQRSGMIQTEKQYQFLYLALKRYIDNLNSNNFYNNNNNVSNHFVNN